jgi:hypothetical protein
MGPIGTQMASEILGRVPRLSQAEKLAQGREMG